MNKDFILITGHGIFPTASILQVVPVIDSSFEVSVVPPSSPEDKFIFSINKHTSINLDIARENPTKKKEIETITDYGFSKDLSEEFDFSQDEFIEVLGLSEDSSELKELKGHFKDYHRRLKKVLDYNTAVVAIESNPDLPDYEASLSAIKQNAPSTSTERKQEKTLSKIKAIALEKVLGIIESADEDDDDTVSGKALIDIINSDDSLDSIESAANGVLKKFYNKNFEDGWIEDENNVGSTDLTDDDSFWDESEGGEPGLSEEQLEAQEALRLQHLHEMADDAVETAETIRNNPDTITNK